MLLYGNWLALEITTRIKLANEFGILKVGSTHVVNNAIQSDGYLIKDIESKLNLVSIQNYLGTRETDLSILWNMLVDKIEGRLSKPIEEVKPPVIEVIPTPIVTEPVKPLPKDIYNQEPIITKRRGRPAKTI